MEPELHVTEADPRDPDVRALLERHLAFTAGESPPEDVHALDVAGLLAADLVLVACRDADGTVLGVGAVAWLDEHHAELKSMHTAREARGRGVATAVLTHLLDLARRRGCRRVSLETGTPEAFAPARALYARAGFEPCPPFGRYRESPYSSFWTRELTARHRG